LLESDTEFRLEILAGPWFCFNEHETEVMAVDDPATKAIGLSDGDYREREREREI